MGEIQAAVEKMPEGFRLCVFGCLEWSDMGKVERQHLWLQLERLAQMFNQEESVFQREACGPQCEFMPCYCKMV